MKDLTVSRPFNEDEYNELLRQAVAVIDKSWLQIAKQLNTVAMSSYWEIGQFDGISKFIVAILYEISKILNTWSNLTRHNLPAISESRDDLSQCF